MSGTDTHDRSSNDRPLVSVVIPAFNAVTYLQETVESVLRQAYPNLEVIVVDDGSTDNTADVAAGIAAKDSRVRTVRQDNAGVAAARNRGIKESSGDLIMPLDADDVCLPGRIEMQVDALAEEGMNTEVGYCWSAQIDAQSNATGQVNACRYQGNVLPELLFGNIVGNASASMIRRRCLEAVGGFDTDFHERGMTGCEDRDLYLRIAENHQFSVVSEVLLGYRVRPRTMSCDHRRMLRSHRLMMEKFRARIPGLSNQLYRSSDAFFLNYLSRICLRDGAVVVSTGYLLAAAWHDPGFLACRWFYKSLRVRAVSALRKLAHRLRGKRYERAHRNRKPYGECLDTLAEKARGQGHSAAGSLRSLRMRRIEKARVELAGLMGPMKCRDELRESSGA